MIAAVPRRLLGLEGSIRVIRQERGPAAVAAVSEWKFYPGMKDGLPVNTRMQQSISFQLEDVPKKK